MAKFFIRRPIFAWVIAIVIMLGGALAISSLSISQYPEIAPTTVRISASYNGASAETVEKSVTSIIEDGMTRPRRPYLHDVVLQHRTGLGYSDLWQQYRAGHCPGAGAEQAAAGPVAAARRCAVGRHLGHPVDLEHPARRRAGIDGLGTQPRRTRRHLLDEDRGPDQAPGGRRQHRGVRHRLRHARVARSLQAQQVPADPDRRHHRHPGPEHPGVGRLDRRTASGRRTADQRHRDRPEPAQERFGFRIHHSQGRDRRRDGPSKRRRPH